MSGITRTKMLDYFTDFLYLMPDVVLPSADALGVAHSPCDDLFNEFVAAARRGNRTNAEIWLTLSMLVQYVVELRREELKLAARPIV